MITQSEILEEAFVGRSVVAEETRKQIRHAAEVDMPVLLSGESGTGKDIAAKCLHKLSARSDGPFVHINIPAVPANLFESELFGHEQGAFTGAMKSRAGKFEQAHGGTLFLDEIGELEMDLQAKLLQVLQDFRYMRLGGVETRTSDVRLICATNRNLQSELERGAFRADLFYRINVIHIVMPPLRSRKEDVPELAEHFLRVFGAAYGKPRQRISSSVMHILSEYHWPGNVRELENLMKRYIVLGGEEHILSALRDKTEVSAFALETVDTQTPLRIQTKRAVRALERRIILKVLEAHQWNRRRTARSLDISYRALLYKIKEAGVAPALRRGPKQP